MNAGEIAQEVSPVLNSMPLHVWIILSVTIIAVVATVIVGLIIMFKGKDIKIKSFSATEKEQIQAESRELSDNQMRTAKIHIGSIRVLLRDQIEEQFDDVSQLEMAYLDLLITKITDNLLEQFRIDLVRNHIVKKNDEELKVYTQAKAQTYYTKVKVYLDDYNYHIPRFNFKKLIEAIAYQKFYDIYYTSYLSAKQLSAGY